MAEILFQSATIQMFPLNNITVTKLSISKRTTVYPVHGAADAGKGKFVQGSYHYAGSFVGVAQTSFDIDASTAGTLQVTLPSGSAVTYAIKFQNVTQNGNWQDGGPMYVSGQFLGTKTS